MDRDLYKSELVSFDGSFKQKSKKDPLSFLLEKLEKGEEDALYEIKRVLDYLVEATMKTFNIRFSMKTFSRAVGHFFEKCISSSTNKISKLLVTLPTEATLIRRYGKEAVETLNTLNCIRIYSLRRKKVAFITPIALVLYGVFTPKIPHDVSTIISKYYHYSTLCWKLVTEKMCHRKVIRVSEWVKEKLDIWEVFVVLFLLLCGATSEKNCFDFRKGCANTEKAATWLAMQYLEKTNEILREKRSFPTVKSAALSIFRSVGKLTVKLNNLFVADKKKTGYRYYLDLEKSNGDIDEEKLDFIIMRLRGSVFEDKILEIYRFLKENYEKIRQYLKYAGGRHSPLFVTDVEVLLETYNLG